MKPAIFKISGAIIAFLAQCAVAISEPNRFLTLEDYVSYAEAHNTGLKNSYQQ